jgi:hypothetical protein
MPFLNAAPPYLAGLLTLIYGICWVCSSYRPGIGVLLFAFISLIASLPRIFMVLSIKVFIGVMVAALIITFPLLWPLGLLLAMFNVFSILRTILSRFFLLLATGAAYLSLTAAAAVKQHLSHLYPDAYDILWVAIAFLIGALALQVILALLRALGYSPQQSAAFILGVAGFYIILIFSFLLLFKGHHGGDGDFTGDNLA